MPYFEIDVTHKERNAMRIIKWSLITLENVFFFNIALYSEFTRTILKFTLSLEFEGILKLPR